MTVFWAFETPWSRKVAAISSTRVQLTTGGREIPRRNFRPFYLVFKSSDASSHDFIVYSTYLITIMRKETIRTFFGPEKEHIFGARTLGTLSARKM